MVLQAGAIAVRIREHGPEVLIVRAKRNPNDWIFPKGHIEPGEDAATAAVRELLEEAGVVGRVADLVGTSEVDLGDRQLSVSYYLVWYEADGLAKEQRDKAWLRFADAQSRLTFSDARRLLTVVEQRIGPTRRP